MAIYDNFSTDPGLNNKAPPLGAPEGALPRKQISDTFRVLMAATKEVAELAGTVVLATELVPGIVEIATDAEVQDGLFTRVVVTPGNLRACTATETRRGVVELATVSETLVGTDATRAVTPAGVTAVATAAGLPFASTTTPGKVELATSAEAQAGTDTTRAVTPAGLLTRTLPASTTVAGIIEVATDAETFAGAFTAAAVSPAGLANNTLKGGTAGYIKYPGGLMDEFGFTTTSAGGLATVAYPIQYPSVVLSLHVTPIADPNNYICRVKLSATSGFTMAMFDDTGAAATAGITFFWRSMGH